jgi:site-specific DNA recombinase
VKRYAIYRRVSTEEQSRPGHFSLEAQLAECERYVAARGGDVVMIEQDVQTGHSATREGYQRVKAAARRRDIDAVLVWKLDRFGRNFREWINATYELEQEIGVAVESVTDSNDPLTRNIMMSVAEQYLRDLSRHTTNGLRYRAQKGEWSGAPPIGYQVQRVDGVSRLVPDPKAPLVASVFEEAAAGTRSLAQLSEYAKGLGLRGRTGHYLSRQALGKILRNPTYRGALVYGRVANGKFKRRGPQPVEDWIVTEDAHPAIVSRETFAAVQVVLSRHRTEQGTVRASKHLLTSLIYCGVCAGTPGPSGEAKAWRMYGNGTKTPVYNCSRRQMYGDCSLGTLNGTMVERIVKDHVAQAFTLPAELWAGAADYLSEEIDSRRGAVDQQRRNLQRELDKHKAERLNLARQRMSMAGSVIPEDVYQQLEREEGQAVATLEREIAGLRVETDVSDVQSVLDALQSVTLADFTHEDWRDLLVLLVARVVVRSRDEIEIEWVETADVLRKAVARVAR